MTMSPQRNDADRPQRDQPAAERERGRPTGSQRDPAERVRSPWPDEPVLHDA